MQFLVFLEKDKMNMYHFFYACLLQLQLAWKAIHPTFKVVNKIAASAAQFAKSILLHTY